MPGQTKPQEEKPRALKGYIEELKHTAMATLTGATIGAVTALISIFSLDMERQIAQALGIVITIQIALGLWAGWKFNRYRAGKNQEKTDRMEQIMGPGTNNNPEDEDPADPGPGYRKTRIPTEMAAQAAGIATVGILASATGLPNYPALETWATWALIAATGTAAGNLYRDARLRQAEGRVIRAARGARRSRTSGQKK